ncbi:MAG: adenylyl-sulfate kinase, partial [Simkaniaceae bacterium]|nr:adenylyl-sulfate kinase [Simkaniaceae bacterium]
AKGARIPAWFSYPDILSELRAAYRKSNGFCVYFTGLSGSGKTTLAQALKERLLAIDPLKRKITILDGDVIRRHLSKGLGFSKQDRSINVQRIGYVASLVVRNGGICICANIAPYSIDRNINREMITKEGSYFEVFVNTPLAECEKRDVKGLYKAAREGRIPHFTGISDPFEAPENAEMVVDGSENVEFCLDTILKKLKETIDL